MHDRIDGPLNPVSVRNELAGMRSRGTSTPEGEVAVRTKLATAKIDKAIREAMAVCPAALHPAQVEYLCGLIVAAGKREDGGQE
jgi:hypothetical protein